MKRILILFLIILVSAFGCDLFEGEDDQTVIIEYPTDQTTDQESTDPEEIDALTCPEYHIDKIACTAQVRDEDGFLSSFPYEVSERIYQHATSAIYQCFSYENTYWAYSTAMRYINEGRDIEKAEEWFMETMREYVGYEPKIICPDGCEA